MSELGYAHLNLRPVTGWDLAAQARHHMIVILRAHAAGLVLLTVVMTYCTSPSSPRLHTCSDRRARCLCSDDVQPRTKAVKEGLPNPSGGPCQQHAENVREHAPPLLGV